MKSVFGIIMLVLLPVLHCFALPHDPTEPMISTALLPAEQDVPYQLESILFSPTRAFAVINAQTVGIGDTVDNARVMVIKQNEVVVFTPSGEKTLYLFDDRLWGQHP